MRIWQFKVKSKVWLENWEEEYINLKVGDSFRQRATLSKKLNNCIGEIVVYYNSYEIKNKNLYKGIYLVCKIISDVYEEDYENWIDMEVIFDYRENPYLYHSDFPELHKYHNTVEIRKRAQTYEYINREICNIEIFYEKIISYNCDLNIKKASLKDYLDQKIEEIESFGKLKETEKEALIKIRIGQSKFRQKLIDYWKGCSVTQYKDEKLLIASHIKPWKDSENNEKLDRYNGLLLTPTLDKLFDRGYISFDDEGCMLFSKSLNDKEELFLNEDMKIKIENEHKKYLKFHRDYVFKK